MIMSQRAVLIRVDCELIENVFDHVPDYEEAVQICKYNGYEYQDYYSDYYMLEYECINIKGKDFVDDAYLNRLQDIYSVPMVMAAHWLISKECLHKVGGFSPTFPHYGEDNNYADRALYHELLVGIVPKARAVHDRENRRITNKQKTYMNYIYDLIMMSNIYDFQSHSLIRSLYRNFKNLLFHHDISYIRHFIKLLNDYRYICHNKKASKIPHAFLNNIKQ